MALMTGVCAVVFVFHTGIAFTTSLATLIACSTVMEFGMGMLDTGRLPMPPLCGSETSFRPFFSRHLRP